MTDMEMPVWFFLATLFVVMLWASYLCGKKLHNLKEELEERLKAATDDAKEAEAYAEELEAELHMMKTAGVIEVAVRNPNVSDYVKHWEVRAEKAEAKLQDQTRLIKQLFALLDITEQKDDGRDFHPNIIRSSRALDAEKLEEILGKLRGYINE